MRKNVILAELVRQLLYCAVYTEQTAGPIPKEAMSDGLLVAIERAEKALGETFETVFERRRLELVESIPCRIDFDYLEATRRRGSGSARSSSTRRAAG